ncbi:MAG: LacI family DNA-binding transcriptional regulator [Butyricicoccus sp.]|nr:LacI family DNA-binding transcriptional regulator [Butyricicoccus sp.]
MKVTIKQIADIAGVSRGTVDRALHNRDGVNPQIRDQILAIAEELGYRPNAAGKQLSAMKVRFKIGVVLPQDLCGFWTEVHRGVNAAAKELEDYGVTVVCRYLSGFSRKAQLPLLKELKDEGISALALAPVNDPVIAEQLRSFIDSGIPVATFNTEIENVSPLCYVGSDYDISGRTAAGLMHLFFGENPIRLLMLTGSNNMLSHTIRSTSFLQELDRCHPNWELVQTCRIYPPSEEPDQKLGYDVAYTALKKHPEINAVFTTAGSIQTVARAIHDRGMSKKLVHISFDRNPTTLPALNDGSLTAVIDQDAFTQGYQPIRILFDRLVYGTSPASPRIIVPNSIYIRQNSAF